LAEISRKIKVPYSRIWKATKEYGDPSQHQKFNLNNKKYFYNGEYRSITYIANVVKLKPSTLMRRLRTGVAFDVAIARSLQPGVNFR
jgi:hypothetical protein